MFSLGIFLFEIQGNSDWVVDVFHHKIPLRNFVQYVQVGYISNIWNGFLIFFLKR